MTKRGFGERVRDYVAFAYLRWLAFIVVMTILLLIAANGINAHDDVMGIIGLLAALAAPLVWLYFGFSEGLRLYRHLYPRDPSIEEN